MGTRADFYVGRGKDAEWLGSIAMDGYPEGISNEVKYAENEAQYRDAVTRFLAERNSATTPEMGWPWPWEDSRTTDYAYAFDAGKVWASAFGHTWFLATSGEPDDADSDKNEFPDMKARQKITFGKRSGLLILGA